MARSTDVPASINGIRLDDALRLVANAQLAAELHYAPKAIPEERVEMITAARNAALESTQLLAVLLQALQSEGVSSVEGVIDPAFIRADEEDEDELPETLSDRYPRPARSLTLEINTERGETFYCWRQVVGVHGERWIFESAHERVAYVGPLADLIGDSPKALKEILNFWSRRRTADAAAWGDNSDEDDHDEGDAPKA